VQVITKEGRRPIKIWTDTVEPGAMEQLENLSRLRFIDGNGVVAMPDVHFGIGATVGSVIATRGAVIPAAVGVDIGCGMNAVRLNLKAKDLPDSLAAIRSAIEAVVPTGNASHEKWVEHELVGYKFLSMCEQHGFEWKNAGKQIGTLGGGNHFIELCLDENQDVWIMLHSGSRGIGNQIGRKFIEWAKEHMEAYGINLPHKDLAFLAEGTTVFDEYIEAMTWAQEYAAANREHMMQAVHNVLQKELKRDIHFKEKAINCHHNYTERENHFGRNLWVTRKGAIRARDGDLGIVPGSMGAKSYIVRGKGNNNSYCSCPHGAGRQFGRNAARERFTVADLAAQTAGVECRKDEAVLDEIPGAYKDIDVVMKHAEPLVDIVHTLKQVMCIKGA
jgi:tRNA-splicing ligase RtcB